VSNSVPRPAETRLDDAQRLTLVVRVAASDAQSLLEASQLHVAARDLTDDRDLCGREVAALAATSARCDSTLRRMRPNRSSSHVRRRLHRSYPCRDRTAKRPAADRRSPASCWRPRCRDRRQLVEACLAHSALAWSKRASAIRRSWFSRSGVDQFVQDRVVETLPEVRVGVGNGAIAATPARLAGRQFRWSSSRRHRRDALRIARSAPAP
jgi:hypothetical protein